VSGLDSLAAGDAPVLRGLKEAREAALRDRHAAREAAHALPAMQRQRDGLREAVVKAWAEERTKEAHHLADQLDQIEMDIARQPDQAAGVELRAKKSEAAMAAFVKANCEQLLAHQAAGARDSRDALEAKVRALVEGIHQWMLDAHLGTDLIRLGERTADQRVPGLGQLENLVNDMERVLDAGIPTPTPRSIGEPATLTMHHPPSVLD
jgi:hypothetical protein